MYPLISQKPQDDNKFLQLGQGAMFRKGIDVPVNVETPWPFFYLKIIGEVMDKKEYQRDWVKNRRKKLLTGMGPCVFCGSTEDIEIHHINPDAKESHKIWSWKEERAKAELKQCIPMCKDCHSLFHTFLKMKPIEHGTLHAYQRYGCRCEECKKARSDYYWEKEHEKRVMKGNEGRI